MFDLTITFSGLCMLVRDPASSMVHVLMPFPTGHPHFARLIFVDQAGQVQKEDITGMHLELQGVTGNFNSDVHSEVFDFGNSPLGNRTVPRPLLDPVTPVPNPPVRTRMRLMAGQHGNVRRRGGFWNFPLSTGPHPARLPTAMDWIINDINQTHLVIEDKVGGGTFNIFPLNGRIHLLVVHVTDKELLVMGPDIPEHSNCPPNQEKGHHFGLYGGLLDPPGISPLPEFDRPTSHAHGICLTPLAITRSNASTQEQTAAMVAAAAAAAAGTATSAAPGDVAAAAAAATSAASTALAAAAAAAGGSELTCMITTAPAG